MRRASMKHGSMFGSVGLPEGVCAARLQPDGFVAGLWANVRTPHLLPLCCHLQPNRRVTTDRMVSPLPRLQMLTCLLWLIGRARPSTSAGGQSDRRD